MSEQENVSSALGADEKGRKAWKKPEVFVLEEANGDGAEGRKGVAIPGEGPFYSAS